MNPLLTWSAFSKLSSLEKRRLLTELIGEKLGIRCEARIYRVLTRLTFQTLRKKYELSYEFTNDEVSIESFD